MAKQMEILLNTEQKPEVEALLQVLDEMTPAEQKDFLVFIQGVRFAKGLSWEKVPENVVMA